MSRYLYLLLLFLLPISKNAQSITLNQGSTTQKEYYSEIPFENINNKLIVPVVIENKTYRFLLDTGAPCVITSKLSKALQAKFLANINTKDANGKSDTLKMVSLQELKLGDITFQDIPAIVADNKLVFDCFNIDGFIGSNMLRNSVLQLSSVKQSIILTDSPSRLKLNKKHASKLYLYDTQSSPYIKIKLKNKEEASEELLFDTGMNNIYDMSLRAYEILKPANIFTDVEEGYGNASIGIFGNSESTKNYRFTVPQIKINGMPFKNITIETTNDQNSRMGAELIKHGLVTLDYKNKYFYFEPYKDSYDLSEKRFGFKPTLVNDKLVVGIIWDDSIKGIIGIGDEIVQIDDVNYDNMDHCLIITQASLLKGKDTAVVTFRNSVGDLTTLTLNRK
ncbi:retropepsin-like aspartic protease [Flavobacterium cerinum]|uniref:Retroviral-like aspartic protease family protein n=1 Tax=Flavobacterium cerinum TaxID=2502784 RepID=A0ABY5ITG5_9FLAO|nr:retropepsin-like aspartic protease [Flavobacterium cerinum]UUC45033.1 retroviral-like aspartic protease family protein [Flavobacterium cerinum]